VLLKSWSYPSQKSRFRRLGRLEESHDPSSNVLGAKKKRPHALAALFRLVDVSGSEPAVAINNPTGIQEPRHFTSVLIIIILAATAVDAPLSVHIPLSGRPYSRRGGSPTHTQEKDTQGNTVG